MKSAAPAAATCAPGTAWRRGWRRCSSASFRPFLDDARGTRNRRLLGLGVAVLIALSLLLPATGLVVLKMLPFDNKSEFQVVVDMPAGTPLEQTAAVLRELGAYLGTVPEVTDYQAYAGTAAPINFNGLVRQYYLRRGGNVGDLQVNLVDKHHARRAKPRDRDAAAPGAAGNRPPLRRQRQGGRSAARAAGAVADRRRNLRRRRRRGGARWRRRCARCSPRPPAWSMSTTAASPTRRASVLLVDRRKAALLGVPQQAIVSTLRAGLAGEAVTYLHDAEQVSGGRAYCNCRPSARATSTRCCNWRCARRSGKLVPIRELVTVSDTLREQPIYHKDLLPVIYVVGDMAGKVDSPLYGMFQMRSALAKIAVPGGGQLGEYFIRQPDDPYRDYALKWDGEWQITYETFRDMGAAYAVGLVLIYLLVVAQFGSYLTPLIIMAPIPLTIIGVMPGHALLGAQFTATIDDRHDRAGRHHRAQFDPAGRFHQPAGARRRAVQARR